MVFRDRVLVCVAVVVVALVPAWLGASVASAEPTDSPVPIVPIDGSAPSSPDGASADPSASSEPSDDGDDMTDVGADTAVDNTHTLLVLGGAVLVAIVAGGVVALVKR